MFKKEGKITSFTGESENGRVLTEHSVGDGSKLSLLSLFIKSTSGHRSHELPPQVNDVYDPQITSSQ